MLQTIYFDNAATTRIDERVLDSMMPWLKEGYGNASSAHLIGRSAKLAVETARRKIASLLGCSYKSIIFTNGGTESANTAIRGVIAKQRASAILTAQTEHKCVLQPVMQQVHDRHINFEFIVLEKKHRPSMNALDSALQRRQEKSFVALMHANNETGALNNLSDLVTICQSHKAILFSDTVCTVGHLPLSLNESGIDLCSASAHKFHGPKGIGFLYIKEGLEIAPLLVGGGHEFGLRAGTENVASIVGMASALELAINNMEKDRQHIRGLRANMQAILESLGAVIHSPEDGLYTILSAGFKQTDKTAMLLQSLDMKGIAVSGGSACSAGKGSHVMEAIGASEFTNIRFSFSRFNTMEEVEETGEILTALLKEKHVNVK